MEHPGSSLQGPVAKRAPGGLAGHSVPPSFTPAVCTAGWGALPGSRCPAWSSTKDDSMAQGISCWARQHLLVLLAGLLGDSRSHTPTSL